MSLCSPDLYGMSELDNSSPVQSRLLKIRELVNLEVKLMTSVTEVMGSLGLLANAAENSLTPVDMGSGQTVSGGKPGVAMETEAESGDTRTAGETNPSVVEKGLLQSIGAMAVSVNSG